MYKDKDKQREANRQASQRRRDKGMTKGMTNEGMTAVNEHTQRHTLNKSKPERTAQGNIRVSKPGDADYEPQCETTRAYVEDRARRPFTAERGKANYCFRKRGKDIKCFADLPADVQRTINRLSQSNEEKAKRTTIAIAYQYLYPDRYYSVGL